MNIGQKIKRLRKEKGLTTRELAEKIGCSNALISFWERGHSEPRPALRKRLCDFLSITESELYSAGEPTPTTLYNIPVISSIAAGDPGEYVGNYPEGFAEEFISSPVDVKDKQSFALKIEGNSMAPRYIDGDYVIASPSRPPSQNRPVIAKINKNEITCKLYKKSENSILLIPVNPEYQIITCEQKDVHWVYPVVGMYRKER